jgi:hypothetical protein
MYFQTQTKIIEVYNSTRRSLLPHEFIDLHTYKYLIKICIYVREYIFSRVYVNK